MLIRAFGIREIASGIGILASARKAPGVWARIGGDVLDLVTLGAALVRHGPKRANAAMALAAVAPVVALDVLCANELRLAA